MPCTYKDLSVSKYNLVDKEPLNIWGRIRQKLTIRKQIRNMGSPDDWNLGPR